MRDSIPAVTVRLTQLLDDGNPPLVECLLIDSSGKTHTIVEKLPVVSLLNELSEKGGATGSIACEVLSNWQDDQGRHLAKINTQQPWHIESSEGVSEFTVLTSQMHTI